MKLATSLTDRATPVVVAIRESLRPEKLNPIVGRAAVNLYRQHFFAKDRDEPNAIGGTRTHFWAGAAKGTHFDLLPDGVMISTNQVGVRQRLLGGTITPKKAKYLTIPARAEAYGKRASEFNDLIVLRRGDHQFGEPYALARAVQTTLKRTGEATARALGVSRVARGEMAGGEILFWLKKSVTQRPDPSAVPTAFDLYAAVKSNVNSFVAGQADRARKAAAGSAVKGSA